jgi:hypothetical protein
MGDLKPDIKKTISKVSMETLRTPNIAIFFQSLKLYLTLFYAGIMSCCNKNITLIGMSY